MKVPARFHVYFSSFILVSSVPFIMQQTTKVHYIKTEHVIPYVNCPLLIDTISSEYFTFFS
jgi:hypothetical protein